MSVHQQHGCALSWYHVVLTTYGAWLPGDPRGFRTRNHRFHVAGDYKSPPAIGKYEATHRAANRSLKQSPVYLDEHWQQQLGSLLAEAYEYLNVYACCMAIGRHHLHVLVKQEANKARLVSGRVKLHAANHAIHQGWQGKLWAKLSREQLVIDQKHQQNVYRYILAHAAQGAWIWKNTKPLDNQRLLRGMTR